jgi:uncharacterized protein
VILTNDFQVDAPLADTWSALTELEGVVPCLPGASLDEQEGDTYKGSIKIVVGSVSASYRGTVRVADEDPSGGRIVLEASGKDTRGRGTARATITAELSDTDGGGTAVRMNTEMAVTGIIAQFGRGVLEDVSARLMTQFAQRLEEHISPRSPEPT